MKRFILITCILSLAFAFQSQGSTLDVFEYNEAQIADGLKDLDALDAYLNQNQSITLDQLLEYQPAMVPSALKTNATGFASGPDNFPAFCCGCALGPVGVLIVLIITDGDIDEVAQSGLGCLAAGAIGILSYMLEEYWWWLE